MVISGRFFAAASTMFFFLHLGFRATLRLDEASIGRIDTSFRGAWIHVKWIEKKKCSFNSAMCWGFRADLTLPKVGFSSLWCNNLSWKVRFAAVNVTKVQIYCGTATSTRDFFFFFYFYFYFKILTTLKDYPHVFPKTFWFSMNRSLSIIEAWFAIATELSLQQLAIDLPAS